MTEKDDTFKDVIGDPGQIYYERLAILERENAQLRVRVGKIEDLLYQFFTGAAEIMKKEKP